MNIPNPYQSKHYKKLMIIPVVLVVLSLLLVAFHGIPAGVELKGGLRITVLSKGEVNTDLLKEKLAPFSNELSIRSFETPAGKGVDIEMGNNLVLEEASTKIGLLREADKALLDAEIDANYKTDLAKTDNSKAQEAYAATQKADEMRKNNLAQANAILALIKSTKTETTDAHKAFKIAEEEFSAANVGYRDQLLAIVNEAAPGSSTSLKEVGAVLSKFFFVKTQELILVSFILSAIVILLVFRSIVPSIAVIFGAVADLVITMGVMSVLGIPLSLATVSVLLMLIGFSLDTDMLLTIRVLKRTEGTPAERAFNAFSTGFMLNLTTIVAFGVLAIIGAYLRIDVYYQIGIVTVIGGIVDFIATWSANAGLILWHAEKREKHRQTNY